MTEPRAVLVTGATGFVGRAVVGRMSRSGWKVRAAVRELSPSAGQNSNIDWCGVGDIGAATDWTAPVSGCGAVVHLAARVHVMHDAAADPLAEFRRMNVTATLNLARQAAAAGVPRFIFVSSVKVNGEEGLYKESDPPAPRDPYGMSKHEAELALHRLARETGLQVVIVRPPLVYGPGARANFHALMSAVARGIPLPFGAVHNRRSLVAVDNLADFIETCVHHPAAANQTFLVSDGEDLSTPELIRRLARVMGRPARLVPIPPSLMMAGATLLGRHDLARRLLGSLQVDISKARTILGWGPPIGVIEGLRRAVAPAE